MKLTVSHSHEIWGHQFLNEMIFMSCKVHKFLCFRRKLTSQGLTSQKIKLIFNQKKQDLT